MDKDSLSNIVESLKKTEMEETNEIEHIKRRMEEFEKRGKKRPVGTYQYVS